MASAADIQGALDIVHTIMNPANPASSLTEFTDWISKMFTPAGFASVAVGSAIFWDGQSADKRTVYDWVVPSLISKRLLAQAPSTGRDAVSSVILVVNSTLLAVQAARVAGRITQDQEDTVVAAFNAAF